MFGGLAARQHGDTIHFFRKVDGAAIEGVVHVGAVGLSVDHAMAAAHMAPLSDSYQHRGSCNVGEVWC